METKAEAEKIPIFENPIRILMTQRRLCHPGGTEIFTWEVAGELRRRGHQVAVYTSRLGELADLLFAHGIPVRTHLSKLPWKPDVIHGQHHLQAVAAFARFPDVPAVYHCHGGRPWVEKPPLLPAILRYITMCENMRPRLESEFGIARHRICTVPNFVNTARFSRKREPPQQLRKALLFGNTLFSPEEIQALESACAANGITLDKVGSVFRNPHSRPEILLPDYDLVFAVGKSAIEALACGCAVIPVIPGLAGHLLTKTNCCHWAKKNFSPRYYSSSAQVTPEWLAAEIACYEPDSNGDLCEQIRKKHTLQNAVDRLESVYGQALSSHRVTPLLTTTSDLSSYLETVGADADQIWDEWNQPKTPRQPEKKIARLEKKLSEQQRIWKLVVEQLRPSIFGRLWLSRIHKAINSASEDKSQHTDASE